MFYLFGNVFGKVLLLITLKTYLTKYAVTNKYACTQHDGRAGK